MVLSFFFLSLSVIVGLTSASPVENTSQTRDDVIDYSKDMVLRENPFPTLLQNIVALTGYGSTLSNAVETIDWLYSNFAYIIMAAVVSFCRMSHLCLGLEAYLPQTRMMSISPEYLEVAERFLIIAMERFFEASSS